MTSDQDILGLPLKFAFSAENLKGLRCGRASRGCSTGSTRPPARTF